MCEYIGEFITATEMEVRADDSYFFEVQVMVTLIPMLKSIHWSIILLHFNFTLIIFNTCMRFGTARFYVFFLKSYFPKKTSVFSSSARNIKVKGTETLLRLLI